MCAFETEVHYSMILIQQNLKIPILLVPCVQRVILFKIYVPRKYFREIDTGHKQNDIEPEDQLFKTISVNFSLKKKKYRVLIL